MKIQIDKYTLEFTLASISEAENKYGLNIKAVQEIQDNPISGVFLVIKSALLEHHRTITDREINDLINNCSDVLGLTQKLIEMWGDVLESIQSKEKNLKWEVV